MSERIASSALYQEVANRLRRRIYQHELKPGQAIDERALCQEFGISRTPLREALKVLHAEGMVELVPRRGCFVKTIDLDELHQLFPVMAMLEGFCARVAVQRCTPADMERLEAMHARLEAHAAQGNIDDYYDQNFLFHKAVQDLSGNPWLQRMLGDLRRMLRLARHDQLTLPGRLQDSLEEHRRIMEAFRKRDEGLADNRMREHLLQMSTALDQLLSQKPGDKTGTR